MRYTVIDGMGRKPIRKLLVLQEPRSKMNALQLLYEAILNVKFDRRNFYKKMLHLGLITQLEVVKDSPKKEAFLYKFNPAMYKEMKQKGFLLEF
ncbi:MAG: hypothetical protein Q4D41_02535 [Prevotellaceae bacterium]|nr:hypothetical protein [Prevotellaceae bacterium]